MVRKISLLALSKVVNYLQRTISNEVLVILQSFTILPISDLSILNFIVFGSILTFEFDCLGSSHLSKFTIFLGAHFSFNTSFFIFSLIALVPKLV